MTSPCSAKRLSQLLCALTLGLASQFALAATEWQLNPAGNGLGGASRLSALDVGGVGYVQILPSSTDPTGFNFIEHGAYQALQSDKSTPFGAQDLTITYTVMGHGSLLNPFALSFTSGSINLYADRNFDFASTTGSYGADNGNRIASFSVFGGGLNANGMVSVQANAVAGSVLAGYLFAADGSDLAKRNNVLMNLGVFNQQTTPDSLLVAEVVCGMAGSTGAGCNGTPFVNTPFAYTVKDGGYATISAVPEPEMVSMLLAGLGLISVVARRRRAVV
ncbi:flocculation-associated PEP-CTERM protein PepA [Dechloromonas denitrificans]|nr:flocculation-associated PEP-CTERM protein PepA [Dechloromonas denitrificans]